MAKVSTYLNFPGEAEDAANFYKGVFNVDLDGDIMRFGDLPAAEGMPSLPDNEQAWIMHASLTLPGGHALMLSDVPTPHGGDGLVKGNNVYISYHPDTRAEADRLFAALSEGGKVEMAMSEEFWGDYFGSFTDKFGVQWMINTSSKT